MPQNFNTRCADVQFSIVRGDTFYYNLQVQDQDLNGIDLSEYTSAKMQVRENEYSNPVLTLSSSGNTIDISNLVAGQIILNAQTSSIINANHYYYDLQLSNNTKVETVMKGKFIVIQDVTI
jgi:hypothetical protein